MMKCKEILAALSDYMDGDLDPELSRALQKHLADCNPCQIVVDNVRQTITLYKSGRPLELPAELCERLRRALRERWEIEFPPAGD
jgi:anti-sigma factor RsiW